MLVEKRDKNIKEENIFAIAAIVLSSWQQKYSTVKPQVNHRCNVAILKATSLIIVVWFVDFDERTYKIPMYNRGKTRKVTKGDIQIRIFEKWLKKQLKSSTVMEWSGFHNHSFATAACSTLK